MLMSAKMWDLDNTEMYVTSLSLETNSLCTEGVDVCVARFGMSQICSQRNLKPNKPDLSAQSKITTITVSANKQQKQIKVKG